jgi:hypothetical protein
MIDEPFQLPDHPMTGQEVMAEVERYFAAGLGNPILAAPILDHFKKTGNVVHAVMATFKLEKVTMYRRRA